MGLMEKIWIKAKADRKLIALPEGNEPRTLKAVEAIKKEGLADVVLLGNEEEIRKTAAAAGANIEGVKIINPETSEKFEEYAQKF